MSIIVCRIVYRIFRLGIDRYWKHEEMNTGIGTDCVWLGNDRYTYRWKYWKRKYEKNEYLYWYRLCWCVLFGWHMYHWKILRMKTWENEYLYDWTGTNCVWFPAFGKKCSYEWLIIWILDSIVEKLTNWTRLVPVPLKIPKLKTWKNKYLYRRRLCSVRYWSVPVPLNFLKLKTWEREHGTSTDCVRLGTSIWYMYHFKNTGIENMKNQYSVKNAHP